MAEVARRRRLAAPVKLPSSTTVRSTRSWSTLGMPGACISNFLKRTFSFIRVLWTERNPIFSGEACLAANKHRLVRPTETIVMTQNKSRGVWDASECALLLIDYQEHVLDAIFEQDRRVVELNARTLAKAALDFKIPVILST